ncbi:glycosyltransferase family 39 protein [Clostridium botulinum]|nr:glycosyltransferase family 39 protein [Clostridium botulinum]
MGSNDIILGKILNVIFSSITLIIILNILLKVFHNKKLIYITLFIITFLPNYIAYNNVLGSEVLITLLLSIIIYLQLCNFNNKFRYAIIGLFIGLATLTKPFFILYPVIIAITEWLKNKNIKETFKIFLSLIQLYF